MRAVANLPLQIVVIVEFANASVANTLQVAVGMAAYSTSVVVPEYRRARLLQYNMRNRKVNFDHIISLFNRRSPFKVTDILR